MVKVEQINKNFELLGQDIRIDVEYLQYYGWAIVKGTEEEIKRGVSNRQLGLRETKAEIYNSLCALHEITYDQLYFRK